ncbi:hypothetical protein AWB68_08718 [Caballeronia choica]|uniref:Uncharacterized protein n=1 Tax=Caballeronia choica TaxID=326476 RepID=A0A158L4P7_9BURK|nr:hypothetical protein AWB68_08718 [Caballeronia choica]
MILRIHTYMQQRDVARIVKPQLHAAVVQAHIAGERLHCSAQRWLFPDRQRQHAQIGQASRFREQQSEGLLAAQAGRLLQQPSHRIGTDHHIRIDEDLGRQLGQPQHPKRIQPH